MQFPAKNPVGGNFVANATAILLDENADCPEGTNSPCPTTLYTGDAPGLIQEPTSLSLSLGPKTTYSGTHVIECNGTDDRPGWVYSRCATFVLEDQNGTTITAGSFTASESVPTVSSNPANLRAKTGGGPLVSGTFQDFWGFVGSTAAPQLGQYVKSRQSITIRDNNNSLTYSNIRSRPTLYSRCTIITAWTNTNCSRPSLLATRCG